MVRATLPCMLSTRALLRSHVRSRLSSGCVGWLPATGSAELRRRSLVNSSTEHIPNGLRRWRTFLREREFSQRSACQMSLRGPWANRFKREADGNWGCSGGADGKWSVPLVGNAALLRARRRRDDAAARLSAHPTASGPFRPHRSLSGRAPPSPVPLSTPILPFSLAPPDPPCPH